MHYLQSMFCFVDKAKFHSTVPKCQICNILSRLFIDHVKLEPVNRENIVASNCRHHHGIASVTSIMPD